METLKVRDVTGFADVEILVHLGFINLATVRSGRGWYATFSEPGQIDGLIATLEKAKTDAFGENDG